MTDGIVVDANIIPQFSQELGRDNGPIYYLLTWLHDNVGLAVNDFIVQEWEDVCKDEWFLTWYADGLRDGKIRKIESVKLPDAHKKKMRIEYGFPTSSKDYKYIICAFNTDKTKYIITENYHFYDPKCLKKSSSAKNRAKEERRGSFCIFLFRELGIKVGTPNHCKLDFAIA